MCHNDDCPNWLSERIPSFNSPSEQIPSKLIPSEMNILTRYKGTEREHCRHDFFGY